HPRHGRAVIQRVVGVHHLGGFLRHRLVVPVDAGRVDAHQPAIEIEPAHRVVVCHHVDRPGVAAHARCVDVVGGGRVVGNPSITHLLLCAGTGIARGWGDAHVAVEHEPGHADAQAVLAAAVVAAGDVVAWAVLDAG